VRLLTIESSNLKREHDTTNLSAAEPELEFRAVRIPWFLGMTPTRVTKSTRVSHPE